jgi:pyruvate dehydrogenase (quinone)
MSKVAESSVKTLIEARVKRIYGIVGDSLNQITDAIRRGNLSNGFTFATRR